MSIPVCSMWRKACARAGLFGLWLKQNSFLKIGRKIYGPSEFRSFQFEKGYKIGRNNKQKLPKGRMYSTNKFLDKEEVRAEIKKLREKYSKNEK